MIMLGRLPFNRKILHFRFCKQKPQPPKTQKPRKSYVLPDEQNFKDQYDYFSMRRPMKPSKPIAFKNGRCLIYLNKQNLLTPYLISSHLWVPFLYIAFLIKTNPFYLSFPAALPIMFILQGLIILRIISHKAHFKNQIERVYLLETGQHIQLVYSNKIRRFIKDNEMVKPIIISTLHNKYDFEEDPNIEPLRGTPFPTSKQNIQQPSLLQYGWTKRDKFFRNIVVPSRNYEYMDWDLMIATMNGQAVDVTDSVFEGSLDLDNCPTVEQELENLKNKKENPQ